ncbi:hypothetical protein D3C76_1766000 [compost metagenome]
MWIDICVVRRKQSIDLVDALIDQSGADFLKLTTRQPDINFGFFGVIALIVIRQKNMSFLT